jgi:hypothetical protein
MPPAITLSGTARDNSGMQIDSANALTSRPHCTKLHHVVALHADL